MTWGLINSSEYLISQWLFVKGMGLCYLFAFSSIYMQIKGLWSSRGVDPFVELLDRYERLLGGKKFLRIPSIFWWWRSDRALHLLASIGIIASLAVIAGIAVVPMLLLLYLAYLSFCAVGSIFLCYQWDMLLLELGFLSIFYAWQTPASPLLLLLVWFLLFRFMFASGLVKLTSGDPNWRKCTAMSYHHESQPLPSFFAWYIHKLPAWWHQVSCYAMFVIELLIPFAVFGPAPAQLLAFILLAGLQVIIAISGNYCFFNFMTVVLCVAIVPDHYLSPLLGDWITISPSVVSLAEITLIYAVAAILWILNIFRVLDLAVPSILPVTYRQLVAPFSIVNAYGLFAVMTTVRNEIIVEGSDDGEEWLPYEFKWKPGSLRRRPGFVVPHQPRLDWQMWFAALGTFERNAWFARFLLRLLEGEKAVLDLMDHNPFPDNPPKYVRAVLLRYRFSTRAERAEDGCWWSCSRVGPYSPVLSLKSAEERGSSTTFSY